MNHLVVKLHFTFLNVIIVSTKQVLFTFLIRKYALIPLFLVNAKYVNLQYFIMLVAVNFVIIILSFIVMNIILMLFLTNPNELNMLNKVL